MNGNLLLSQVKLNRLRGAGLVLMSLLVIVAMGTSVYECLQVHNLALAAGSATGESYMIGSALKTLVERHYSNIRLQLVETGGTAQNLRMLEAGQATLADAQADDPPGASARTLAVLYEDTLQLLTDRGSSVQSFSDLKGKVIALPQSGG